MIKYLDLKRINDLYDAEIREAINEVLDSGWYLKGEAQALHRLCQRTGCLNADFASLYRDGCDAGRR